MEWSLPVKTHLLILGKPEEFADEFPPVPAHRKRQIGFATLLRTLSTPAEELRQHVEDTLNAAERTGYPVLIHLDDWNYPPQYEDPEWVEWSSFPQEGARHGPVVRRRWLSWGSWFVTGAPPNYESPAFKADLVGRLQLGVAEPIASRLEQWRPQNKTHLFAGVVAGWESGYYTMTPDHFDAMPTFEDHVFGNDEFVRTGYAALTVRGHTAASIRRIARQTGRSEAEVMHALMTEVVHDYTAFWCRTLSEGGIPETAIYTHYTPWRSLSEARIPISLRDDGRVLPLDTGINPYGRPGFTVMPGTYDLNALKSSLKRLGRNNWGAVEIEFVDASRSEAGALSMLERLSSSGARVLCVFGWWEPEGHPFAVRGSGAVAGMHAWLDQG